MLAILKIASLGFLAIKKLCERVLITTDSDDSVGNTGAQCSVKSTSVMTTSGVLVWDDIQGV